MDVRSVMPAERCNSGKLLGGLGLFSGARGALLGLMAGRSNIAVLHYTGAGDDRGGIMSVVRSLAGAGVFECVVGVSPGFVQHRRPPLPVVELPHIDAEAIGPRTWWRARGVARAVRTWLGADSSRVFHAHSRAGLLTALHLVAAGERRVVASVHCYGLQRWFYRYAARRLGARLFWLSPAMKRHYGLKDVEGWAQCMPSCIEFAGEIRPRVRRTRDGIVRLGGVGMMVAWKRWDLILDAFAKLPAAVREQLRFAHIGSPVESAESQHYAAALRARTSAMGLAGIVDWRGEQGTSEALLEEIDSLVVLSRAEPFSVAMLEALRAGVPVLAARSGGPGDVLCPPRNGWFFKPDDLNDLVRVITMLVESDALNRTDVRSEDLSPFAAPSVAARWVAIYEAMLARA